jgi:hypothetical protein
VEEQLFKTIVLTIVPEMPKQEFFVAPPQREGSFPKHTHTNPARIYEEVQDNQRTIHNAHIQPRAGTRYIINMGRILFSKVADRDKFKSKRGKAQEV